MREILFRGKRLDNGEWVERSFCPKNSKGDIPCIIVYNGEMAGYWFEIDPATMGQYTGIDDKNGKRIFEDDIVQFARTNALGYTNFRTGYVRYYDELPIFYIMEETGDAWDWCECREIEVIGNIHDNPELLEGGAEGER